MSIKNSNKNIIVSSVLTGKVLLTLDYDDYDGLRSARDLLADKMYQLIDSDDGVIIKLGYKG